MVSQSLLNNTNVQVTSALGGMQVLEYVQDMSVSPSTSKLQLPKRRLPSLSTPVAVRSC